MSETEANILTPSEIRRVCGDLPDATVQAILGTGATFADLEAAAAPADDQVAVSDIAASVREILDEDAGWDEGRD